MKTIKELSDELGYTKQYVSQTIRQLGLQSSLRKIGNKFAIDEEQENLIRQALEEKTETKNRQQNDNKTETELSISLRSEIDFLRSVIEKKDKETERLYQLLERQHQLLDQLQQLTLQEQNKNILLIEQIEQLEESQNKKWWQFWKHKN